MYIYLHITYHYIPIHIYIYTYLYTYIYIYIYMYCILASFWHQELYAEVSPFVQPCYPVCAALFAHGAEG